MFGAMSLHGLIIIQENALRTVVSKYEEFFLNIFLAEHGLVFTNTLLPSPLVLGSISLKIWELIIKILQKFEWLLHRK